MIHRLRSCDQRSTVPGEILQPCPHQAFEKCMREGTPWKALCCSDSLTDSHRITWVLQQQALELNGQEQAACGPMMGMLWLIGSLVVANYSVLRNEEMHCLLKGLHFILITRKTPGPEAKNLTRVIKMELCPLSQFPDPGQLRPRVPYWGSWVSWGRSPQLCPSTYCHSSLQHTCSHLLEWLHTEEEEMWTLQGY